MAKPNYYQNYQDALERSRRLEAEHNTNLDAVIDGLGIRAAYPNETTEIEAPDYCGRAPFGQYHMQKRTITTFGRHRFLADVRLAADAARGAEASARIAAALKGKK